jgi:acyl carrier protein
MTEIERSVADYLTRQFGIDGQQVDVETPLISSGLLDSFGMVELLLHIEALTGRKVDPGDVTLENLDSIGRIATLIQQLRGA